MRVAFSRLFRLRQRQDKQTNGGGANVPPYFIGGKNENYTIFI